MYQWAYGTASTEARAWSSACAETNAVERSTFENHAPCGRSFSKRGTSGWEQLRPKSTMQRRDGVGPCSLEEMVSSLKRTAKVRKASIWCEDQRKEVSCSENRSGCDAQGSERREGESEMAAKPSITCRSFASGDMRKASWRSREARSAGNCQS